MGRPFSLVVKKIAVSPLGCPLFHLRLVWKATNGYGFEKHKNGDKILDINFDELTLDDLKALQKSVAKAIQTFEARQKADALAAAEAVAREAGYSLKELLGATSGGKVPAAPKYRHPENSALTWSGRGRKPKWFVEAIEQGKTPEDLAI